MNSVIIHKKTKTMGKRTSSSFCAVGHAVMHYPFTGWHTGKSIKDGRGIQNLLKQLKAQQ